MLLIDTFDDVWELCDIVSRLRISLA